MLHHTRNSCTHKIDGATLHCSQQFALHNIHRWVQRPSTPLILSVVIIACGTALAGYGELNVSVAGMLIQLVSETAEAVRLIMTQTLLQGMSFHPIEGLMYLAPASLVWMALCVMLVEGPQMVRDGVFSIVLANPGLFLAAATMGFCVMTLAFFTIQLCGSLTLKVWQCSGY